MEKRTVNLIVGALLGAGVAAAFAPRKSRSLYSFRDKVVLITGGSRGLGLVLARKFAAEGAKIAICARDRDELGRAASELNALGTDVFDGVCDVRDPEEARGFVTAVRNRFGVIDVLVNNAGVIQVGPLETQTRDDFGEALGVHFWGPFNMIEAALPAMRKQGSGRIVNISSIGGKVAVPHLAPYCVSKFALTGLSDALRAELGKDNIHVTTVCPGLMRTGSHINAKFKGQNEKEFALFSLADATSLTSVNVQRAAVQILEAARRGDAELIISVQAKLAVAMKTFFPELTADILGLVNRLLPESGGSGKKSTTGLNSSSAISPSFITSAIDRAAAENNELDAYTRDPAGA